MLLGGRAGLCCALLSDSYFVSDQAVAVEMGGRTPGQVQHFYQDNLSNCYKKGAWDPEEDEALRQVSTGSGFQLCMQDCGAMWVALLDVAAL